MYSKQIIEQAENNLSSELEKHNNYAIDISNSKDVQDTLKTINESKEEYEKYKAVSDLRDVFNRRLASLKSVSFGTILLEDDVIHYSVNNNLNEYLLENKEMILEIAESGGGKPVWTSVEQGDYYHLINVKKINNISTSKKLGYMVIGLRSERFLEVYKNINLGDGADLFIIDSKGRYISNFRSKKFVSKSYKPFSTGEKLFRAV